MTKYLPFNMTEEQAKDIINQVYEKKSIEFYDDLATWFSHKYGLSKVTKEDKQGHAGVGRALLAEAKRIAWKRK